MEHLKRLELYQNTINEVSPFEVEMLKERLISAYYRRFIGDCIRNN